MVGVKGVVYVNVVMVMVIVGRVLWVCDVCGF